MAEVEYSTRSALPKETVWDFVSEMDHWAPFVTGYQEHQKQSETESLWTLKGDLGVMSRTLVFKVRITEWSGPERVRFELEGQNEPMRGGGCFELSTEASDEAPAPQTRPGLLRRWLDAVARWLFRMRHGPSARAQRPAASGGAATRLSFRLRIVPGGPMAPMVDAMITPLLTPAAEQLAERILATVEERGSGRPPAGG